MQSYIQFDVLTGILTRCNSYHWLVQQRVSREESVHISILQIFVLYRLPSVMIRIVSVETKRYTGLLDWKGVILSELIIDTYSQVSEMW